MVRFWDILFNIFRTQPVKSHLFSALKDIQQEILNEEI